MRNYQVAKSLVEKVNHKNRQKKPLLKQQELAIKNKMLDESSRIGVLLRQTELTAEETLHYTSCSDYSHKARARVSQLLEIAEIKRAIFFNDRERPIAQAAAADSHGLSTLAPTPTPLAPREPLFEDHKKNPLMS